MSPGKMAGAEKVVLTGLKALVEIGLCPLMIIIKEERNPILSREFIAELDPRIQYRIVSSKKAIDWNLVREIKRVLKEVENIPYIIHTHGFKALVTTKLVFSNKAHFHTHHGNTGHTFKVKCYEAFAFFVMRFCTHIVAVSKQMEILLLKELYPIKSISTIDNMLSLTNAKDVAQANKQRDINYKLIRLIFIGRISEEKGLSDFLRAWSKAKNRDTFHLTILGDGPLRNHCQELALELSLSQQSHFEGFTKTPADFLVNSDLLIMPSHTEGLPMTLIEAASCGLPVLANNVGAITQIVEDNINGHLISMTSHKDLLIDQWREILERVPEYLEAWKKQAHLNSASIREHYSAETWANKTKNLYINFL